MKSTRIAKEKYTSSAQSRCLGTDTQMKNHQQQPSFTTPPQANHHHTHSRVNTDAPTNAPTDAPTNSPTQYQSATILKGFILFSLALMISLTILYIVRHCIVDMVVRYGLNSKHEMLMYLLALLVLLGSFGLYYNE